MAGASDRLRGVPAIQAHLRTHGPAFDFDRHQIYRLSQRSERPLPVDGAVGLPVSTRAALDAWVVGERRRGNRTAQDAQLTLFDTAAPAANGEQPE